MDLQFTTGKFQADLFSMTNAVDFEDEELELMDSINAAPDATAKTIVLDVEVLGDVTNGYDVQIAGFTQDATAAEGKFSVAVAGGKTTLTFAEADTDGTVFEVNYRYKETVKAAMITNKASAVGECILKYPVYSDGTDCTKSGIKGMVIMKVFRARVTAQPGLNGSYKTASTWKFHECRNRNVA